MKHAGRYVAGEISFNEFARANESDWRHLARYLMRRFPSGQVAEDDVVQELLISSWQALGKYDAARGVTPDRYCTFNALRQTKRRLLRQLRPGEELVPNDEVPTGEQASGQQQEVERVERLRELLDRCGSLREAVVLIAFFREEDRHLAASALYRDPELRRLCRFGSEQDAYRTVRQSLNSMKPRELS